MTREKSRLNYLEMTATTLNRANLAFSAFKIFLIVLGMFLGTNVFATNYSTVQSGNWTSSSTWSGGNSPGNSIVSGDSVFVTHSVNYNHSSDLDLYGYLSIKGDSNTIDTFYLPAGRKVTVDGSSAELDVFRAAFINPIFTGGSPNSGSLENKGGLIRFEYSFVEIAQNWSNDNGVNIFRNGTYKTGQNYSSNGTDTLENVCIDVGLQGSGAFDFQDGSIYFSGFAARISGSSGNFNINSGTVDGYIQAILFVSSNADITVSSSVNGSVNLVYYCMNGGSIVDPSNILQNETNDCTNAAISFPCLNAVPNLPVEMLSFTGIWASQNIQLEWSTGSELNNDRFEVERWNEDFQAFEFIGFVEGNGNSNEIKFYNFTDYQASQFKANLYRLKQMDFDGKYEYSNIISLEKNQDQQVAIYPNPASGNVQFAWEGEEAVIRVLDASGRVVLDGVAQQGQNRIDLTELINGFYIVEIQNRSESQKVKLQVLK